MPLAVANMRWRASGCSPVTARSRSTSGPSKATSAAKPSAWHLARPVQVQSRTAPAAQEGRLPDPRRSRQRAQEVRSAWRTRSLPVLEAISSSGPLCWGSSRFPQPSAPCYCYLEIVGKFGPRIRPARGWRCACRVSGSVFVGGLLPATLVLCAMWRRQAGALLTPHSPA